MQISINPNQAIRIETFEEFQATAAAVETSYPRHDLVPHLRELGRKHYNLRNGHFIPPVLTDQQMDSSSAEHAGIPEIKNNDMQFASVAYDALKRLSRSTDPHYAPVARFMLDHALFVDDSFEAPTLTDPVLVLQDPVARG